MEKSIYNLLALEVTNCVKLFVL